MTKHEAFAARKGRTLVKIQGRMELWHGPDGPWLYSRTTKRWARAHVSF